MGSPERVILDISSDEEVGWGEGGLTSAVDGDTGGRDDADWLAELLDEFEGKADDSAIKLVDDSANELVDDSSNELVDDSYNEMADDSDEVVVVDEIFPCKKRKVEKRSAQWERSNVVVDDDDDDACVILDGDPDKPVEVNDVGEHDDSDELLLVSEKGQVACRDYPHPRHLCVKFAFSSFPHEMHCDQCHCYVCDSRAPCVLWGTGDSSIDHCNATDKEEYWKCQRKSSMKGGIVRSVVPNATTNTSLCVGPTDISQSTYLVNNVQNLDNFRPAVRQPVYRATYSPMHRKRPQPCSMLTDATTSNATMRGRMPVSHCNARSKYHQHLASVSHKLPRVGNANPQPTIPWKSSGTAGHLMTNNRHDHFNATRHSHPLVTGRPGPRFPAVPPLEMQMHQRSGQIIHEPAGPNLTTLPNIGISGLVTPHASPHHVPPPTPHSNGVNANLMGPWSQWIPQNSGNSVTKPMNPITYQPHYRSGFPHMLIHCQTTLQSNAAQVPQNPIPYQPQMISSSDNTDNSLHAQPLSNAAEAASQNPVYYPHHILSTVNTHSHLNDVASSQAAVYPQPSFSSLLESQMSNQNQALDQLHSQSTQINENETAGISNCAEIGTGWNSHTNETNENIAGSSQQLHQSAVEASPNDDLKMLAEATELEFDDWFIAHDSRTLGLGSLDIPLPNNIQSTEFPPITDNSLFDF